MITQTQENNITDYLVSKQLSVDLLVEIRDHMINQIMDLQLEEKLDFEEAFSKVKESWKEEFIPVSYWMFFSTPIPFIAKKIIRGKYNRFMKTSFLAGLVAFIINIVLIFISNSQETYTLFFKLFNALFLFVLGAVWIMNFRIWKYLKQDFKFRGRCFYTMYQQNMVLMLICTISMFQIITKNGHYAYQFFREQNGANLLMIIITLIVPFILQTGVIFTLLNFFEHKKSLLKMKDFLSINISSK
ncbi:hypothetical protein [Chryseobacterium artocarpi]|uniref:hypothetical protein n=1 Tax=Chryseobacterium artocarpi TaxID=1414727 RepID=UPI003F2C73B8